MRPTITENKKRSINQKFYPYWLWEETRSAMWGRAEDREGMLQKAIDFTGNHCLYGIYMGRVIEEWKISCLQNLSNKTQNRRAWLGHAACAIAINCPEDIVRQAWNVLTEEQRGNADAQAERVIKIWEDRQWESDQLELTF